MRLRLGGEPALSVLIVVAGTQERSRAHRELALPSALV